MLIQKLHDIKTGAFSAEKNIKQFLDTIKKENQKYNIVLHVNKNAIKQAQETDVKIKQKKAGSLAGLGFLVKSNINVKGLICNCASKTLEHYEAAYNATVIDKLLKEDAIVLGMTNMDEFACGGSGETSAFGPCKNPAAIERIPGGSSSGSAAAIAANFCDFALGSDTGGSIRNPASHCGVVGFKPSYGAVSRYGLIDLSMSLDQISPLARTVEDAAFIFNIIKGKDERDARSRELEKKEMPKKVKIGVLQISVDKRIEKRMTEALAKIIAKNKWTAEKISLKHMNLGIQTYYPIVYVEFFSGTRKFDGRKYGAIIEESCGEEVARRIIGGQHISKAESVGKYYRRALHAKKIIQEEFAQAFKKYDCIVMPTVPRLPHKLGEKISVQDMYNYDALTVLANLAGIPAISIPMGTIQKEKEKIPVGLQIQTAEGTDIITLKIAENFEQSM